jgi:hypothetical protein
MANNPPMEFMVEDARLLFKNFSGAEGQMNAPGDRNFCVVLDESVVEPMIADGWNVKRLKPLENEGDDEEIQPGTPYIKVKLGYKGRPPHIVMRTSRARTPLTQDTVEVLDWADIETVDLIAQSYHWSSNQGEGISAYLKSMYVTVREDYLQRKYAELDAEGGMDS